MTLIERSKRLADALKAVGIEVEDEEVRLAFDEEGEGVIDIKTVDIPLTDNLMVLMDVGVRELDLEISIGAYQVAVHDPATDFVIEKSVECFIDWQSALCAALVDSLEKKLGIGKVL